MASSACAGSGPCSSELEPRWLTLYRAGGPPQDVAVAWFENMGPDEKAAAQADAPAARKNLRESIVASECPEYRADVSNGFKFTGAVLRAADEVLGIPPPKPSSVPGIPPQMPGAGAQATPIGAPSAGPVMGRSSHFKPRRVLEGDGRPGTLGLWWSDFETASDARRLREECGITHRLNVAAEAEHKLLSCYLETLHVPMEDTFDIDGGISEAWAEQLAEILEKLRGLRNQGAVVNVNCNMGKNRSGAALVLWLCCECGWSFEEAVQYLRRMNTLACGNPHLLAAVGQLLGTEARIPLNPAHDGGGWVCISPPGSPREGGVLAFENAAAHAIAQQNGDPTPVRVDVGPGESGRDDEAAGDMSALFDAIEGIDDVD